MPSRDGLIGGDDLLCAVFADFRPAGHGDPRHRLAHTDSPEASDPEWTEDQNTSCTVHRGLRAGKAETSKAQSCELEAISGKRPRLTTAMSPAAP